MKTREWLKKMRQKFGLTQAQLSEKSGVNKLTIENIEQGRRKGSEETWKKIEEYFNFCQQNDDISYSFASDDLIAEIKEDIEEFGKDKACYLMYKIIDKHFFFVDYQFLDSKEDIEEMELDEDEKKQLFNIETDLDDDEYYIETTLEYALKIFEKQNQI